MYVGLSTTHLVGNSITGSIENLDVGLTITMGVGFSRTQLFGEFLLENMSFLIQQPVGFSIPALKILSILL